MTRRPRTVVSADGEVLSELDIELPAGDTTFRHDPRKRRRWVTRPVPDPWNQGDER